MKSQENLDKLTKRPIQYWFEDGIGELITGGLFALIGIYFTIQQKLTSPLWIGIFSIFSIILIIGGTLLGRILIGKLKEHLIYPRTGYVGYSKQPSKGKLIITLSTAIGITLLIVMLGNFYSTLNWVPIITGLICGILMLYQGIKTGIFRLYLEAVLAPMIGVMITFSSANEDLGNSLFFLIYGAVLIFGGGCALRQYFKQAPPAETNYE